MAVNLHSPEMDQLFEAVLSLQSKEECYAFFEDCCTISELQAMAQRLQVARLLDQKMTYTEISEKTGASTATVSRVGKALHYGEEGYALVLSRLEKQEKE